MKDLPKSEMLTAPGGMSGNSARMAALTLAGYMPFAAAEMTRTVARSRSSSSAISWVKSRSTVVPSGRLSVAPGSEPTAAEEAMPSEGRGWFAPGGGKTSRSLSGRQGTGTGGAVGRAGRRV